jgi:hypothetical protein
MEVQGSGANRRLLLAEVNGMVLLVGLCRRQLRASANGIARDTPALFRSGNVGSYALTGGRYSHYDAAALCPWRHFRGPGESFIYGRAFPSGR